MTSSGPRFKFSERFSNATHVNQVLKQHTATDGRTDAETGQPKKSFQLANCQIEKAPEGATISCLMGVGGPEKLVNKFWFREMFTINP